MVSLRTFKNKDGFNSFQFGNRDIHIQAGHTPFTPDIYQQSLESGDPDLAYFGWEPPPLDQRLLFIVVASNWYNEVPLRADSYLSYGDAYLKLLFLSQMLDDGVEPTVIHPTESNPFYHVPFNFKYYPSKYFQEFPDTTFEQLIDATIGIDRLLSVTAPCHNTSLSQSQWK